MAIDQHEPAYVYVCMAWSSHIAEYTAELGRNPVSKHQIQPEYGDEQAESGAYLRDSSRVPRRRPFFEKLRTSNNNTLSCNPSFPCLLFLCGIPAWRLMELYSILPGSEFLPYILLFTQAPNLVCFDGTIIDIGTILLTMYYSVYVLLWLVALHGD